MTTEKKQQKLDAKRQLQQDEEVLKKVAENIMKILESPKAKEGFKAVINEAMQSSDVCTADYLKPYTVEIHQDFSVTFGIRRQKGH